MPHKSKKQQAFQRWALDPSLQQASLGRTGECERKTHGKLPMQDSNGPHTEHQTSERREKTKALLHSSEPFVSLALTACSRILTNSRGFCTLPHYMLFRSHLLRGGRAGLPGVREITGEPASPKGRQVVALGLGRGREEEEECGVAVFEKFLVRGGRR